MQTRVSVRRIKHGVDLRSSTLTIAVAQLEGPLPRGKHPSVVGGRESYEWTSLEAMNTRMRKASDILDSLGRTSKPDIVVFPEYSLPIDKSLSDLQIRADQYNCIVVPGADSIRQKDAKLIFNQSPIIIPNRTKPIWVTKRELSQWEHGYVDQPQHVVSPTLTWEVDGRPYWISVHICMDFLLVPQGAYHSADGAGIFIVPMCSPETNTFRVYADTLLRSEHGTATVLCNCVGELAEGRSGVIAMIPGGRRLHPAVELTDHEEGVAVFELDLRHLAPPKKTVPTINPPVGKRSKYILQAATEGTRLVPSAVEEEGRAITTRAVINPTIFEHLGKKMRIAFLSVEKYASLPERLRGEGFETMAVLGQHDTLVTHLHQNRYDMIYDITKVIPIKTDLGIRIQPGEAIDHPVHDNFPFFRVDVFFKVLGVPVGHLERAIFDDPERPVPTEEDVTQILTLCNDWYDEHITEDTRQKFLRRKWILSYTSRQPGQISAVMTVFLEHTGGKEATHQATFEDLVLPVLIKKPECTSIYRGRAQSLSIHYILRITSDVELLFMIIEEVHKLAQDARVLISTNTYVVMKRMSQLSLEKALLQPSLPAEEEYFLNHQLLPLLPDEDRARVKYMQQEEQRKFVNHYQSLQEAISNLGEPDWLKRRIGDTERRLATGLLHKDLSLLKDPHDLLQHRVESLLSQAMESRVSDEEFRSWRPALNIAPGKQRNTLTYTETIHLASKAVKEKLLSAEMLPYLSDLLATTAIRNALTHPHGRDKLTLDAFVAALVTYCRFISRWDGVDHS